MPMFPQYNESYSVIRSTISNDFTEPTWSLVATVIGRSEPVSGKEEYLNHQDFQGVSEVAFIGLEYEGIVKPDDYIVDPRGRAFVNKGEPEVWRYMMPYIMLKLEPSQQPVTIPS